MAPSESIPLRTSSGTAYDESAVREPQTPRVSVPACSATAHGATALGESYLIRLLKDPAEELQCHLGRPVKLSHESVVVRARWTVGKEVADAALKQYRPRNWWKTFCGLFRCRALRGWHRAKMLLARDIATPRPIAVCRARIWSSPTSYLATEWIAGAKNLHRYGWGLAQRPACERFRRARQCAESLGSLIGRMHAAGVSHRDLKGANLLVVERGECVATWLVDLDGVKLRRRLGPKLRAANLARLAAGLEAHPWVTRTIFCRFLRAYARQFPQGSVAWKPLWHAVAARGRDIVRRKRRKGEEVL
jgi:tRNA A-37 threonylcarbamoyl transferase component Bud32